MATVYKTDVMALPKEQANLLRSGKLSAYNIEHIAEKIEGMGKSERRELANRKALLLSHLLKCPYQPERQRGSWQRTIKEKRKAIARRIKNTPSLKTSLHGLDWLEDAWGDAVSSAIIETGFSHFPEVCPWTVENIMSDIGLPFSGDTDKNYKGRYCHRRFKTHELCPYTVPFRVNNGLIAMARSMPVAQSPSNAIN